MSRPETPTPEPTRRAFLRQVGRTGAAVAASAAAAAWLHNREPGADQERPLVLPSYRVASAPGTPELAIVHGTAIDTMVRAAIGELGGITRFVRPGDVVLVKPNVAFDRGPLLGATTHPQVVAAVVALCRAAGAARVIVADNPINSPEGAFYKTGIGRAAVEAGGVLMYPNGADFRPLDIGGSVLHRWPVFHRALAGVTRVIGVAPLKDHNLCGASMTMKNWYGLLGGARNQFHQKIHPVIADLAGMLNPTMVILDATRILMTNGPTGGSLADVIDGHTIVAGVDQVAVDAYGFTRLGRDPESLPYLQLAQARGVGNRAWRSLRISERGV